MMLKLKFTWFRYIMEWPGVGCNWKSHDWMALCCYDGHV